MTKNKIDNRFDLGLEETENPLANEETVWLNDSDKSARFRLQIKGIGKAEYSCSFRMINIPAGGQVKLSSMYDKAIRTENEQGEVIGGLCPWLKKQGEDFVNLIACLDYQAIEKELQIKSLASQLRDKQSQQIALDYL